nr:hypothetical protein [Halomonas sp.]
MMKVIAARLVFVLILIAVFDTYSLGAEYPMAGMVHIVSFAAIFMLGDWLITRYLA